jgi:hypothetical protein
MGLTGEELRRSLPAIEESVLVSHISSMLNEYLIVKTGVVTVRFVATAHAKSWILQSFKIQRTKVQVTLEYF